MAIENVQVRSTVTVNGTVELHLVRSAIAQPTGDEVVVRIEATPINPADLIPLLAGAKPEQFTVVNGKAVAKLSSPAILTSKSRVGLSVSVGLEGAGTVIATGKDAEHLTGKRVAVMSITGGSYARYGVFKAADCIVLPNDVSSQEAAGLFTNPLTTLSMVETLRLEQQTALVHTAAASNLGKMLARICVEDGLSLVAIVRREEQVEEMRSLGVQWVCNSSDPDFDALLHKALVETGARIAFDAIGGGETAGKLVAAMERATVARSHVSTPFGSSVFKQVYIYGYLDPTPTVLPRSGYGMTWSVTGWAMPPVLEKVGQQRQLELLQRIVTGIKTTFASQFAKTISLEGLLDRAEMQGYTSMTTGGKYLIDPWA